MNATPIPVDPHHEPERGQPCPREPQSELADKLSALLPWFMVPTRDSDIVAASPGPQGGARRSARAASPVHKFPTLIALLLVLALLLAARPAVAAPAPDDGKLRIICFGAHPDDCEIQAGGTAAMWAAKGHKVKFVSVTNGDIGHWREAGGPLAQRRLAEVMETARILGITAEVLDIHDGELEPTLENRRKITRLIREWNADLVLSHRPNDYHPDHRYTAVLVQDAAYMVTVPFFCPDTPPLKKNPVFMYSPDRFAKPNPFRPDVAVSTDSVIEKRLDAMDALVSQFYEGGANGSVENVPTDPAKQQERKRAVRAGFQKRYRDQANRFRAKLTEFYGQEAAEKIQHAEAFEICEYGRQPDQAELKRLFPFFDK